MYHHDTYTVGSNVTTITKPAKYDLEMFPY